MGSKPQTTGGKVVARETFRSMTEALFWVNSYALQAIENDLTVIDARARRDSKGERYFGEVISVDAEWLRARNEQRRRAREAEIQRARARCRVPGIEGSLE